LVQFITFNTLHVGSALDSLVSVIDKQLNNIVNDRQKAFFDQLSSHNISLTKEMVEDNHFLHAFLITHRIVIRTKTKEKIRLLANMFVNGINSNKFSLADEYDYYLSILDELSIRELYVLPVLEKYEENSKRGNWLYWEDFISEISKDIPLFAHKLEIEGFLERISRTGCYVPKEMAVDPGTGDILKDFAMYRKLFI
jgi:hypothetical protein